MKTKSRTLKLPHREPLINKKLETYKLVFDLMKHLTTLSSGSILILIALVEKVLNPASSKIYLTLSFAGFCISIILAIIAMLILGMNASEGKLTEGERNFFAISAACSAVSFGMGICFVVILATPSLLIGLGD